LGKGANYTGAPHGDDDDLINPLDGFFSIGSFRTGNSSLDRMQIGPNGGVKLFCRVIL
jgi:hypothetical protein